jgi:hypothetical protein
MRPQGWVPLAFGAMLIALAPGLPTLVRLALVVAALAFGTLAVVALFASRADKYDLNALRELDEKEATRNVDVPDPSGDLVYCVSCGAAYPECLLRCPSCGSRT